VAELIDRVSVHILHDILQLAPGSRGKSYFSLRMNVPGRCRDYSSCGVNSLVDQDIEPAVFSIQRVGLRDGDVVTKQ
jgi:hypothetical protein